MSKASGYFRSLAPAARWALALAWLGFIVVLGKEHRRRSQEGEVALAGEPHRV
jgi:hypothetical protein